MQSDPYRDAAYDLNIHQGASPIVLRLTDSGVRLANHGIAWTISGQPFDASLGDIVMIRLTTEAESAQGPMGATACQIHFRGGNAVSVFGGNSFSRDQADRLARYRAFVNDLHQRLTPGERASIRFVAGFGAARFGILLVATLINTLFLVAAPLALLLGAKGEVRLLFALAFGVVLSIGLFRLLQLNAPHTYDPANPLNSAVAGSIGNTLGHTVGEIRRGMTAGKTLATGAIGLVVVAIIVLVVASHATVSLFAPGRAGLAFDAAVAQAGPRPTVVIVEVTPEELRFEQPDPRGGSSHMVWRARRHTLFGWSEWSDVSGPTVRYDTKVGEPDEKFALETGDVAHLDDLAKAAVARAALGSGATVTKMTLTQPYLFMKPEPPRWTVQVSGTNGAAEVIADRHGQLYPATPEPLGPPRIVITATRGNAFGWFPGSDTWIRITNPDRSVRFDGTLKVGDSYSVPDIPGLMLQTGKPDSLEVTVDGRPARLPPAGFAGRVDTVLDPQALLAAAEVQR